MPKAPSGHQEVQDSIPPYRCGHCDKAGHTATRLTQSRPSSVALRKGHVYGTVLIDIESRRPVDVLPERSAESFRAWLDAHPGVEIICRDRGGCYAEGAAAGAPLATQVADRWHLWQDLAEAVERAAVRHRSCLREPPPERGSTPELQVPAAPPAAEAGLAARTRARHAEVHAALARGLTITKVSRTLRLERKTVRRYATAATADQAVRRTKPSRRQAKNWGPIWSSSSASQRCPAPRR
jgi:transposase